MYCDLYMRTLYIAIRRSVDRTSRQPRKQHWRKNLSIPERAHMHQLRFPEEIISTSYQLYTSCGHEQQNMSFSLSWMCHGKRKTLWDIVSSVWCPDQWLAAERLESLAPSCGGRIPMVYRPVAIMYTGHYRQEGYCISQHEGRKHLSLFDGWGETISDNASWFRADIWSHQSEPPLIGNSNWRYDQRHSFATVVFQELGFILFKWYKSAKWNQILSFKHDKITK